nr:glycosyltransferase family 4 protein [Pseudomonas costantinii]
MPTPDSIDLSLLATEVEGNESLGKQLKVLVVGTEWDSRHGGLSTLNRNLCIGLASVGHEVICLVPESSIREREDAERDGVRLISPNAEPGLEGTERLLLNAPLPDGFVPDFVIGHDRKTGPHANVLAQQSGTAKFILFIHTRPENIEWYKDKLGGDDAANSAEDRRLLQSKLASSASLVVGVGPTLTLKAKSDVYLLDPAPIVHRLDPGFISIDRPRELPPEFLCLLLGRADDFRLKGLDIAAKALGEVVRRNRLTARPRLIVRGAPIGTGQALYDQLVELSGGKLEVEVRNYSENVELLMKDIQTASLVLMPSRSEGFGLVALEAIAAKTPVLVSDRSGIASMLRELLPEDTKRVIVETQDDLNGSSEEWERSIEAVLMDREAAFARAEVLQVKLGEIVDWKKAIRNLEKAWAPLLESKRN